MLLAEAPLAHIVDKVFPVSVTCNDNMPTDQVINAKLNVAAIDLPFFLLL